MHEDCTDGYELYNNTVQNRMKTSSSSITLELFYCLVTMTVLTGKLASMMQSRGVGVLKDSTKKHMPRKLETELENPILLLQLQMVNYCLSQIVSLTR